MEIVDLIFQKQDTFYNQYAHILRIHARKKLTTLEENKWRLMCLLVVLCVLRILKLFFIINKVFGPDTKFKKFSG